MQPAGKTEWKVGRGKWDVRSIYIFRKLCCMRLQYKRLVAQYLFLNFFNLWQFTAQTNRFTYRDRFNVHGFANIGTFIAQFTHRLIAKRSACFCNKPLFAGRL